MTEDNSEEIEEEPALNLDEISGKVNELHDTLDQIKTTGQQLNSHLQENASEADDPERLQVLLRQASLLYDRVERGDRNLVRGK